MPHPCKLFLLPVLAAQPPLLPSSLPLLPLLLHRLLILAAATTHPSHADRSCCVAASVSLCGSCQWLL